MTNNKRVRKSVLRKALFSSAISLILCCAMLVGTTFAWFTDTESSINNIIKSGTLDVSLDYYETSGWQDASNVELFNYEHWEPGYSAARLIKISNEGDLGLKFQMNIIPSGISNDTVNLADVIDVYYFKAADENAAIQQYNTLIAAESFNVEDTNIAACKVGNLSELIADADGAAHGVLLPEEAKRASNVEIPNEITQMYGNNIPTAEYACIVLHMQESAGNEYMNKKIGENFAIQILATQLTYENDSFGNMYDKDATNSSSVVSTTKELATALESGKKLIYIKGSVKLQAENAGKTRDLKGVTLSGLSSDSSIEIIGTGGGLSNVNMNNLKVVDSTYYTSENGENAWEFTYLELEGTNVFNNVTFDDGVLFEGNNTCINCSFSGHNNDSSTFGNTTMYGAWVYDGTASFSNCYFFGTRGLKVADQYSGSDVANVIVDNCTFGPLSEKPGLAVDNRLGNLNLTIKNSTFVNTQVGDAATDSTKGVQYIYENDNSTPDVTVITLENNNVINNSSAKTISTAADLIALSNQKCEGEYIITKDIDMNNADFSAIIVNYGKSLFIDGNGHKISNVNVISGASDNTTGQASMFYCHSSATLSVSNLVLENITVTSDENDSGYAAAVVGYCEGSAILDNVDIVNATIIGVKSSGAIVGHLSGSLNASNCDINGSTVTIKEYSGEPDGHYAGKYIGTIAGNTTLFNCTNNITVSGNLKTGNDGAVFGRQVSGTLTVK